MAKEGTQETPSTFNEEAERLAAAERLKELLVEAAKKDGGLPFNNKGAGKGLFRGGVFTDVRVLTCWAYFTHNGERFRTATTADKEKLLAGQMEGVTLVSLDRAQPIQPKEEEKVRSFVPRSKHLQSLRGTVIA